jgi:SAM-dependent methyltransferase
METFSKNEKGGAIYLEQLKDGVDEKVGMLIKALDSESLPRIEGTVRVMEVGVGGGQGVQKIKRDVKDPDLEIYAVDILEPLVRRVYKPEDKVFGVVANLTSLPFAERSFSAINVSAVIHEVISYNRDFLEGDANVGDYLSEVFDRLSTHLTEGGRIFYRDVGLPDDSQELLSGEYNPALTEFLKNFDEGFREKFLNVNQVSDESWNIGEGAEAVASKHYHREIQRHIISFLDYALRQKYGESLKNILGQIESGVYEQSRFESTIQELSQESFIYDAWQRREGSEIYTYLSLGEMIEMVNSLSDEQKSLVVESSGYIERKEYSHFIESVTSAGIRDTKQMIVIRRDN